MFNHDFYQPSVAIVSCISSSRYSSQLRVVCDILGIWYIQFLCHYFLNGSDTTSRDPQKWLSPLSHDTCCNCWLVLCPLHDIAIYCCSCKLAVYLLHDIAINCCNCQLCILFTMKQLTIAIVSCVSSYHNGWLFAILVANDSFSRLLSLYEQVNEQAKLLQRFT